MWTRATSIVFLALSVTSGALSQDVGGPDTSSTPPSVAAAMVAAKQAQETADRAMEMAKAANEAVEKALADASSKPQAQPDASSIPRDVLDRILPKLHPSGWEHLGRSVTVSTTFAEQPAQVLVENVMIPTPQRVLTKGSLTFTPTEFFLSPADISAEVTGFRDAGGLFDEHQNGGICNGRDAFIIARCLVRGRKRDFVYRAISGLSATLSYSENLRVKNNILLNPGSAAASQNNQWSGSMTFSASGLFQNGSDWDSAQKAAAAYTGTRKTAYPRTSTNVDTSVSRELLRVMVRRCDAVRGDLYNSQGVNLDRLIDERCMRRIAGPFGARAWIASAIPDVTYQLQTQFDFVKSGSIYVPFPGLQPSLWNLSAKWDVTKYIPSGKNRLAALHALVSAYKQERADTKSLGLPIDDRP
jgi:hypothetical protein